MANPSRKPYSVFKTIVLTAMGCLLLFFSVTGTGHRFAGTVFAPFVSLWNYAVGGICDGIRFLQPGALHRKDELREAMRRIDELEALLALQEDLRRENDELRRLAGMPPPAGWRAVMAEVIARDPEQWNEHLLVNCGSEEGLVTGAVALVKGQVFGRVMKCYRHSAEIVTLFSPECRFGVAIDGTEAAGVLQGAGGQFFSDGQHGFLIDYLPKELSLPMGGEVVTSGLGGWMPAGIPVGELLCDAPQGGFLHSPDAARTMAHGIPGFPFGVFHFVTILVPKN